MKPESGTKLDTTSGNRQVGICLAACRAAVKPVALLLALARLTVLIAGMMGIVAASQAEDGLAGLTDPTRPSYVGITAAGKARPAGPVLQSTFISASQQRAVIGGRSYMVGDKFGGAVITDIQPYEVVLQRAGHETRLRLLPKLAKETTFVKIPANSQEGGNDK